MIKSFYKIIVKDLAGFPGKIIKGNFEQNYMASIIIFATFVSSFLDGFVREFSTRILSDLPEILYLIGKFYGSIYFYFIIIIMITGYYLITERAQLKILLIQFTESIILVAGIITMLKMIVGRARPYAEFGSLNFEPLTFFEYTYFSFPSGHTGLALTITFLLLGRTKNLLFNSVLVIATILTLMSRFYFDLHWFSDVVFSSGIAYLTTNWVQQNSSSS